MMKFVTKTLITSVAVLFACFVLHGVSVDSTLTAVLVAAVLGLFNSFIRPLLILLTIPITVLTLGLFLFVINIFIVEWVAAIVHGFHVDDIFSALLFSLVVAFVRSAIEGLIREEKKQQ